MLLRTKIFLSLTFLFIMFLIMGGLGIHYIYQLAIASKAIMKDNYASVRYAELMQNNLDKMHDILLDAKLSADSMRLQTTFNNQNYKQSLLNFQTNLVAEANNITEIGEQELADSLQKSFYTYTNLAEIKFNEKTGFKNFFQALQPQYEQLKRQINRVFLLNMRAILLRNQTALSTADEVSLYIRLVMLLGMMISMVFIFWFPRYLTLSIVELTAKIREIANRNYNQKIQVKSQDEVGELAHSFNTMAIKLKEYEESNLSQILSEKKRTEAIIRTMSEAVLVLDENLQILYANPLTQRILGIKEKDLIGIYAPNLGDQNDLLQVLIKDLVIPENQGEEIHPEETIKIFVDEKESFFTKEVLEIKTKPANSQQDNLVGYAIILKNITYFKELDNAKTSFIATVSHELKTPLASIKMSLQLLNNQRIGQINLEQSELINHISEDTNRMLKMVGELLSLSQLETGNIQLKMQFIEPQEIVNYAYETLKMQAQEKNIQVKVDFQNNTQKAVGDLEKASWVLVNLLSNAIRYTPENEQINIQIKEASKQIQFSIQDQGPGIDPRYREKIFEKFFQIPKDENAKSGTGLGLAISKDFITSQGGQIWLESEMGKGCTFYFTLPISQHHIGY